jgi:hypothetical protein
VHVSLQISAMHSYSVSTGLHRSGDRYALRGNEVEVGTYAMFGRFDRERFTLPRHGGGLTEFEIATPRAEWASAPSERRTWVEQRARAVADFWHGSPTATVQLSLMPAPGRDTVLFGKVLPESAPGVMLLLGEAAPRAALDRDWVLVHELFHLGTPSFRDEGRWFDEGLATYFEPLIRVRAGLMSEDALWREYVRGLPLGLPALSGAGAEAATDSAGIYWGGAALCFLADLRVRRASGGRRGLEDGLRALLAAGGTANEVWRLDDAIAVIDRALGAPVLRELASRHARRGAPLSLRERFEDLGLGPRGERLRPSALRDALLRGGR